MRTTLAASFLVAAISAQASGQATLPRTGPNWTYPNGFGQRWVSPPPRNPLAPFPVRGQRMFHGNGYGYGSSYGWGSYTHGHVNPYAPGGHITFYYGPGMSYRAGSVPYGYYSNGPVVVWNPPPCSSTACWY